MMMCAGMHQALFMTHTKLCCCTTLYLHSVGIEGFLQQGRGVTERRVGSIVQPLVGRQCGVDGRGGKGCSSEGGGRCEEGCY